MATAKQLTASDKLKWWSGKSLDIVPEWIESHCVVPDGDFDLDGKKPPFLLRDYQLCFVTNHYAVKPSAKPEMKSSAFAHQLSVLVDAQKKGKSPLVAALICVEALGPALFAGFAKGGEEWDCAEHNCDCGWVYKYSPGEPMARQWTSPLIQVTANSEAQTGNTYDALRPMIDYGPLHDQIPRTGEEVIRLPSGKAAQIVPVTAKAKSRLGARVTCVPWDEAGLYADQSMWEGLSACLSRSVRAEVMPETIHEKAAPRASITHCFGSSEKPSPPVWGAGLVAGDGVAAGTGGFVTGVTGAREAPDPACCP